MSTVLQPLPARYRPSADTQLGKSPSGEVRTRGLKIVAITALAASVFGIYEWTGYVVGQPVPRILFVPGGLGPNWQLAMAGAQAAAEGETVELCMAVPLVDDDVEAQSSVLRAIDPPTVGGVAVCPLDAGQQSEVLKAIGRSTHLVTYSAESSSPHSLCNFGLRPYACGRQCAQAVAGAAPDGAEVAILAADPTAPAVADRIDALKHELARLSARADSGAATAYTVVGVLADGGDASLCEENIRGLLAKHPQLGCIVDASPRGATTMVEALAGAGPVKAVKLVSLDNSDETLEAIERGEVYATIVPDFYQCGFQAVRSLIAFSRYSQIELPKAGSGAITVRGRLVRHDNVREIRAQPPHAQRLRPGA